MEDFVRKVLDVWSFWFFWLDVERSLGTSNTVPIGLYRRSGRVTRSPVTFAGMLGHVHWNARSRSSGIRSWWRGSGNFEPPPRLLVEAIDYNLLYRWFMGLNIEDEVWATPPSAPTASACSTKTWRACSSSASSTAPTGCRGLTLELGLGQSAHGLDPAKGLFDALAHLQTGFVARVPLGALPCRWRG